MKDDKKDKDYGYWRSLEELAGSPELQEFAKNEFPDITDDRKSNIPRRNFLKIMGASLALASTSGCRFPVEKIVPFSGRPMGRMPGEPVYYATGMQLGGVVHGLLAKSFDGRPIKIEGNPEHPHNMGATNAIVQAAVLDLYDPQRAKHPVKFNGKKESASTWNDFIELSKGISGNGEGLYVLSGPVVSPSMSRMRDRLKKKFSAAEWYEYAPVSRENEIKGLELVEGHPLQAELNLKDADVIVSLDADLLGTDSAAVKHIRNFSGRRTGNGAMNRLYVVEPGYTLTGAAADHRAALPARKVALFALELLKKCAEVHGYESLSKAVSSHAGEYHLEPEFVKLAEAAADDLHRSGGRGIVTAGVGQPPEVHALVYGINDLLGNNGRTIIYRKVARGQQYTFTESIVELTKKMRSGKVKSFYILGGNPVYDAPADVDFRASLEKVAAKFHVSQYRNETSVCCDWLLPETHFLESWGDLQSPDGTYTVVQPLISPLYDTRSALEVVAMIADNAETKGYEIVRTTFGVPAIINEIEWRKTLDRGVTNLFAAEPVHTPEGTVATYEVMADLVASIDTEAASGGDMEIVFVPCSKVYDGQYANNVWLQELPDPMTKVTWDNAATMSPATAGKAGVGRDDVVKITVGGASVEMTACILPGHADDSVTVALGYGRTTGRVRDHVDGVDVYSIRKSISMGFSGGAKIAKTGKTHKLAVTQDHQSVKPMGMKEQEKRSYMFVREADLEYFKSHPDFATHMVHHPPLKSLWKELSFDGHRWGMAIDLSKCVGCGTCMTACQAENNVPVVGRDQVLLGREMNWVRVDRYFRGDPASPQAAFQPVPCQQCEMAPCEHVCPVAANVHTKEGLNDMVYNRCIGMRFCSNNCPYKVRRFNYFRTHQGFGEMQKMVFNPDVTVRSRGVMEKCSYCVQRIQEAKIKSKNAGKKIKDGDIVTACAQACPAGAIVFGDYADPESRLSKMVEDRSYAILAEYNMKPRTIYQARIKNPAFQDDTEGGHGHS